MITAQDMALCASLFCALTGLNCVLNLWHARSNLSPEPRSHAGRYRRWMLAGVGLAFVGGLVRFRLPIPANGEARVVYWIASWTWMWLAVIAFAVTLLRFIHNNHGRKVRRRYVYGPAGFLAAGALCLSFLTGCVTNPNTGKTTVDLSQAPANIDLWTTFAEDAIVLATPPGPQQDRLIREAELLRKAADLPSLQKLLASLPKSVPTTQAVK